MHKRTKNMGLLQNSNPIPPQSKKRPGKEIIPASWFSDFSIKGGSFKPRSNLVLLKGSSFGIYALFLEDEEQQIVEFRPAFDLEERRSLDSRISVEADNDDVRGSDCSGIAGC